VVQWIFGKITIILQVQEPRAGGVSPPAIKDKIKKKKKRKVEEKPGNNEVNFSVFLFQYGSRGGDRYNIMILVAKAERFNDFKLYTEKHR